jgi:hypothetical protein
LKRPSSFSYHAANGVKSAHQRVGRQPPTAVPRVATGVAKITGHAGRDPAKVDTAMLTPLDAKLLARKALLLQSAIAGLIASRAVEPSSTRKLLQ